MVNLNSFIILIGKWISFFKFLAFRRNDLKLLSEWKEMNSFSSEYCSMLSFLPDQRENKNLIELGFLSLLRWMQICASFCWWIVRSDFFSTIIFKKAKSSLPCLWTKFTRQFIKKLGIGNACCGVFSKKDLVVERQNGNFDINADLASLILSNWHSYDSTFPWPGIDF